MWDRLQEQMKAKQKPEKLTQHLIAPGILGSYSINVGHGDSMTSIKGKHSEGSGMETDKEEQLDVLINQSAKVLNKKPRS